MRRTPLVCAALAAGLAVCVVAHRGDGARTAAIAVVLSEAPSLPPSSLPGIDALLRREAPLLDSDEREQLAWVIAVAAEDSGLSPALILAVMRVESDFRADAVSARGAVGYMQVRPATLLYLAARASDERSMSELLNDRFAQVHLAVEYLARLQRTFGGRQALALMAYNAGPTALVERLRAGEADDLRPYVAKVQLYLAGYDAQLAEHAALAVAGPRSTVSVQ
jgi:soluble lytic murein transglycosylase